MPTQSFVLPPLGSLVLHTHARRDAAHPERDAYVTIAPGGDEEQTVPLAEVFGCELPTGQPVFIPYDRRVSVFSPKGCMISVEWDAESLEQRVLIDDLSGSIDSLPHNIASVHRFLEAKRVSARQAANQEGLGPRVLVVGSIPSSGKSVLCRTLANYCTRGGYQPLYVELDVCLPPFGFPECVSIMALHVPIDVEEEGSFVPALQLHFGEASPNRNVPLWRHTMQHVANGLLQRAARCDRCRVGGVFMDYPTFDECELDAFDEAEAKGAAVDVHPLDALVASIEILEVDVLVVVGSDAFRWRLSEFMCRRAGHDASLNGIIAAKVAAAQDSMDQSGMNVMTVAPKIGNITAPIAPPTLPLSTGAKVQVVPFPPIGFATTPRTAKHAEIAAKQRWLQYFFGTVSSPLRPSIVEVSLADCKLVRIGGAAAQSMAGLLPLDEDSTVTDPAIVTYILPGDMHLTGRIVALSSALYLKQRSDGETDADGGPLYDPVPTRQFEENVKELRVVGFGLIRQSTHLSLTMLIPEPMLPQPKGHCFILTNTMLRTT